MYIFQQGLLIKCNYSDQDLARIKHKNKIFQVLHTDRNMQPKLHKTAVQMILM